MTRPAVTPGGARRDDDMVDLPAGTFLMGSEDFYPEERPVHAAEVDAFRIDRYPVTVAEFRRFVEETGYVTVAERPLDPAHFPGADPRDLVPGSIVFRPTPGPVPLDDHRRWWEYVPGACWRHPGGPGTTTEGRERHPVVHVAHEDAASYAAWAGKDLPRETEWEYAARGGLEGAVFAWGDEHLPGGRPVANTWQGEFPWQNLALDGHVGTSPVGSFPPNGHGLHDMCGNVWEWTCDPYTARHRVPSPCCAPGPQPGRSPRPGAATAGPGGAMPQMVIKGGSHLCAPNYCLRYRPAARQGEAVDTSTSHIGFRCVRR